LRRKEIKILQRGVGKAKILADVLAREQRALEAHPRWGFMEIVRERSTCIEPQRTMRR
jgi:hypothetical protein